MAEMSLVGFMAHLAHFEHRLHADSTKAMDRVAKIVEREAKKELGHYQDAAAPFAGWADLAESTQDDRVKQGFSADEPGLRTGEMRDGIGHASDHESAVVGSNDDKMVYFELGTDKQPPRSVLGTAVVHKEHDIKAIVGGSVVSALIGKDVFNGSIPIL
jgi:hypothetical protein